MITGTWQALALKFDNKLHYSYPVSLLKDDGELVRLRSLPGETLVHYTKGYQIPNPYHCDLYFWRKRWYNVFVNHHEDGTLDYFYCNVSLPPVISVENRTVSFVDLDLDVRVAPDGTYQLLDDDEFEQHSVDYAYPVRLRARALRAVDEIIALAVKRGGPFSLIPKG
jgi:protein associated with RNAse G/E